VPLEQANREVQAHRFHIHPGAFSAQVFCFVYFFRLTNNKLPRPSNKSVAGSGIGETST
jgi:hypothetical protein